MSGAPPVKLKGAIDSSGNPAGNVVSESKSHEASPSTYASGAIALDGTGVGGACASGALDLIITIETVPTAGNFVLIGFGEDLAEAQGNIDASTPGGYVVPFHMVRKSDDETSIFLLGDSAVVAIPQSLTTPFYAIAETGTPGGEVFVSMRG